MERSDIREQVACASPGFRHSASLSALTRVFDALWTRVNALEAQSGLRNYSAGCNMSRFFGTSQNRCGRSNRKRRKVDRTAQNQASAPTTPASVTSAEIVPTSVIHPVLSSTMRLSAIGRKNAR